MRRYHVGRVDGNGPVFRHETRREAQDRIEGLVTQGGRREDFYLDGPPEPTEADRISEAMFSYVTERKLEPSLLSRLMKAETEEDHKKIVESLPQELRADNDTVVRFTETKSGRGLSRAVKIALQLDAPLDLIVSMTALIGYRTGRAMVEAEQLEKLV